ncbi:MAG: GatB/YqeY domain-containing protein [Acidobacteriota bacterium]|nr:GatB/YqeY domain-containing protein [Acidobacteriota bacterium]
MAISDQITKDVTAAMKARDQLRLSTLRMVKSALKNKEIDKRAPLDDKEAMQVLSTLIKQRKESIEHFSRGGRPELAEKEAAEIVIIESYMPQAVGAEEIAAQVRESIADMTATGTAPTMKDMGTVMKNVMARFAGARVDGKAVSDAVKQALTPKA